MTTQQKTTETPRTDAAEYDNFNGVKVTPYVDADFARQLETELTTATAARLDAERKVAEMRGALTEALPALRMLENQFASSLSSDSRSHDEDRPWRKRINLLIHLAENSTTLGEGWMSPVEVKEITADLQQQIDNHKAQNLRYVKHVGGENEQLKAKLSELEREVERLSKLVKDVGSRNATLERENANMLKTIADVETGIRGVVPEVDGLNVPIPIARRTYNAGCIIDTFRERCARLEEALQWAMQMEPSPCRCMDFATPPHVCKGHEALAGSDGGEKCPVCGAPEVDAMTPRTTYACGSSDYDQRPGTFKQACSEPATIPAGERAERQCAFS
jgi:hypothetical protein